MKKFLCLILAVVLSCSLFGCLDIESTNTDVKGEITNNNEQESNDDKQDVTDNKQDVTDNEQESTDKEMESSTEFSLGKATNNTYKNEYLGLSCTLPSGWTFYDEKEIMELNNVAGDYMDEEVVKQIEEANLIYDMYASHESGSSINVNIEKFDESVLKQYTIKDILESQIDAIKSSFTNMGYTNTTATYDKVTVSGKEYDALVITATIQGVNYDSVVFVLKKDNYLANVSAGAINGQSIYTILSYFTIK